MQLLLVATTPLVVTNKFWLCNAKSKPRTFVMGVMMSVWSSTAQQVVKGLFIGSARAANDAEQMRDLGITHVVDVSDLDTNKTFPGVQYLRIRIPDDPEYDIRQIIGKTNTFIYDAIKAGGKLLVHCYAGISRSSSVVIAYLMAFHQFSFDFALRLLKNRRSIVSPNRGFRKQLAEYDQELIEFRKTLHKSNEPKEQQNTQPTNLVELARPKVTFHLKYEGP